MAHPIPAGSAQALRGRWQEPSPSDIESLLAEVIAGSPALYAAAAWVPDGDEPLNLPAWPRTSATEGPGPHSRSAASFGGAVPNDGQAVVEMSLSLVGA
jgi:hypothetical protein